MSYEIVERNPTLEEFHQLCVSVGWGNMMNFKVIQNSLKNSLYSVIVLFEGRIIGMGRIIGDGYIYFYLQDIVVLPQYQKMGIGTMIMDNLMSYLKENAPDKAFIGLFSSNEGKKLYEKYNFKQYPALTGMFRVAPI
ncbi:GNAT family N-acetyltransferase [Brevibacillus choshinensis]|uniref:GNAT family N-acetyltransferase n=1 Tax=Brevibacillus choshinensis TaxID=54911 RepID=UPI002E220F86|nr:GNAT family N-acetyltransferase [Brevibacillus choshinensis]MED4586104.1 GNAT family N-acetyltransferase [Brevibacillus choshinensis]MED4752226.1 GNAT family N-acetyltransferase [Brevibacillus choshinensis]MED4784657.1 GNAT family N-acetyltransferase [Brevibacillus choshinensis]